MDIAEIRKKAKGGSSGGQKAGKARKQDAVPPIAPESSVSASVSETAAPAVGKAALPMVPSVTPPLAIEGQSSLDRLFASPDGMRFASEEVYQTALAAQSRKDESALSQFLAFHLGKEEYALDINQISEIIKPRDYTDIPRVPDFILGLISLRGVVVPIIDLRQRFQMGRVELSSASRIIVSHENGVTAGLLVDRINQVVKIDTDRIEPPPAVITGVDRNLISGIGRYQGRMIIMLNLASVLEIAPG